MAVKVPIRTVFDGSTATGLAEYQSGEFIGLTHGGTGVSLSIGSAGQVLKVNSGASALEFGSVEAILNIDGMTDGSGITIADGDDFAISDAGTEKKVNASQIATYVGAAAGAFTIANLDIDGGTDIGAGLADADLFIVDDAAGGTNRKTAASRIKTYVADVTLTTAAQTNITSVGTLTALQVDNLNLNGNTLSSTAGTDLLITPLSGQQIVLDGTIVIDAGVVTGATSITSTAFVGDITGDVTGTADVATVATTVTITDNESTDESNALIFTAGGDVDGGNLGLESDGTLTYNPSTGVVTATGFVGALTGNVTGNASGTAATVTTAAQTNITSLGTLTTLTVDNIIINGTNIGHTSDTDSIAIASDGVVTMNQIPVFSAGINVSGGTIAGTLATAAQTNITSLGTLTALTVDNIAINGTTIGHTSDTDAITIASGGDVTLTQDLILGEASSVNMSVPLLGTSDHTFTGLSAQMLAGGAIAAFKLVCIHTTTQEVVTADASAFATARVIGIAPAAIGDTATGTILLQGFIRDDTFNFTTGSTLFLSETAGAMTHTAPTTDGAFVNVVGVALSPDVVYINPSMDVIEHA